MEAAAQNFLQVEEKKPVARELLLIQEGSGVGGKGSGKTWHGWYITTGAAKGEALSWRKTGGKLTCSFLNDVQFGALNAELKRVALWSLIGNWKVCVASFQENRDQKHE